MTNIPPISDGQPVTYEFLNLIVGAVNKLSNPETGGANQDIEVTGKSYTLNKSDPVSIVVGRFTLEFGSLANVKSSTAGKTIKFDGQFKSPPLVFLSALDDSADTRSNTSYISLTATEITKSNFTCRGRRTLSGKDAKEKDTITVNFLALGPSPATD